MQMENKLEYTDDLFVRTNKKYKEGVSVARHSVWRDIKKELLSNKIAVICLVILCVIIIASFLAPLSPYDPNVIDVTHKLEGPSSAHWFGTDDYGRDYFTRALYGGRVSLTVGFSAMIVTVILGTAIGVISGYVGGKLDILMMRFTDIFLALPSMLLMIVLNTMLSPGLVTLILVLSLFSWASVARITRAETMSLKERDFVVASKNLGAGNILIAVKHIVPNIMGPVTVAASLGNLNGILFELFRTGSADSAGVLGKHVTGSTVSYYGYPNAGNLSRSSDIIYSVEF